MSEIVYLFISYEFNTFVWEYRVTPTEYVQVRLCTRKY